MENGLSKMHSSMKATLDRCLEISLTKTDDYASTESPYRNFEEAAAFAGISVEQGLMYMIGTKAARLKNLMRKGAANHESVEDTIIDLINYFAILKAWREEGK